MKKPFYIVDVFAEKKYSGNQLAVVGDAGNLDTDEMQAIACEMNYSETAFILSDKKENDGYNVRIFSLDEELPFAGHPTLGTAFIIQQYIENSKVSQVKLNLPIGPISVSFKYSYSQPDLLWMKQIEPSFGRKVEKDKLAGVLNLSNSDFDDYFPPCEVSTGLPFIIVPLKNLDAVRRCVVDRKKYLEVIEGLDAKSILVFSTETYNRENDINARMFDPYHGIDEDPATGSANGCLAAYLVSHNYFNSGAISLRVEQGYEIRRPSLLYIKAKKENHESIIIEVGGKVFMVAQGSLV